MIRLKISLDIQQTDKLFHCFRRVFSVLYTFLFIIRFQHRSYGLIERICMCCYMHDEKIQRLGKTDKSLFRFKLQFNWSQLNSCSGSPQSHRLVLGIRTTYSKQSIVQHLSAVFQFTLHIELHRLHGWFIDSFRENVTTIKKKKRTNRAKQHQHRQ